MINLKIGCVINKGLPEFESFLQKSKAHSNPLFKAMGFGFPLPRKTTYNSSNSKFS